MQRWIDSNIVMVADAHAATGQQNRWQRDAADNDWQYGRPEQQVTPCAVHRTQDRSGVRDEEVVS
jgi:hypothetical protein